MPHGRRREDRQATAIGRAAAGPAKRGARRDIRQVQQQGAFDQQRLLALNEALQGSIQNARRDARQIGGKIGKGTLAELAQRRLDAAGGVAERSQTAQAETAGALSEAQGNLQEARSVQGEQTAAALSELIADRRDRRAGRQADTLAFERDLEEIQFREDVERKGDRGGRGDESKFATAAQRRETQRRISQGVASAALLTPDEETPNELIEQILAGDPQNPVSQNKATIVERMAAIELARTGEFSFATRAALADRLHGLTERDIAELEGRELPSRAERQAERRQEPLTPSPLNQAFAFRGGQGIGRRVDDRA